MMIMKPLTLPIPYEYGYAQPARGPFVYGRQPSHLEPHDPYFNQRGEAGFYHDTQLGSARGEGLFAKLRRKMLGDPVETSSAPATTEDVVALMNAHNDRLFALTVVSTTAVAVSAIITVLRTISLIRQDKRA